MATNPRHNPDMDDFQPLKKKPKRSSQLAQDRFKAPTCGEDMSVICKAFVPPYTQKNTAWAMRIFAEWRAERNSRSNSPTSLCPDNILEASQPDKLRYWLSHFVNEVRKQNGNPHPPKTVHQILAGLQRHILETTPTALKFLDQSNPNFCDLHRACDTIY